MAIKPTGSYEIDWDNPITAGLVGCWVLDDRDGVDVYIDLTGNNDGARVGTSITNVITPDGTGVNFAGDNNADRIDVGSISQTNPLSCNANNALTIFARCERATGPTNSYPRIFDKSNGGSGSGGYAFNISSTGRLEFYINGSLNINSVASIGLDVLTNSSVTFDGALVNFYINDVKSTQPLAKTIPTTTTSAAIGNWNHSTDRNWHGDMECVYVWDRVLTDAEQAGLNTDPYQFVTVIHKSAIRTQTAWDAMSAPEQAVYDTHYTLPSTWEATIPADLSAITTQYIAEGFDDWPAGIDEELYILDRVTDESRNVVFRAAAGHKHNGQFGNGFRFVPVTVYDFKLIIRAAPSYTVIDGISVSAINKDNQVAIQPNFTSNYSVVKNCLARSVNSTTIYVRGADSVAYNNIVIGGIVEHALRLNQLRASAYNNTVTGSTSGFGIWTRTDYSGDDRATLINNVVTDCLTNYPDSVNVSDASTNNAASDATTNTPPGSNPLLVDIVDADFADAANDDYHLSATSQLIGQGANLYNLFTTDIDGDLRPDTGAWDIGADHYVVTAGDTTLNHDLAILQTTGLSSRSDVDIEFQLAVNQTVGLEFDANINAQFNIGVISATGQDFTSHITAQFDSVSIQTLGIEFDTLSISQFDISVISNSGLNFYANTDLVHDVGIVTTGGLEFTDGAGGDVWTIGTNAAIGLQYTSDKTIDFTQLIVLTTGFDYQTNTVSDFSVSAINTIGLPHQTNIDSQFSFESITHVGLDYTSYIGHVFDTAIVTNIGLTYTTINDIHFDTGLMTTSGLAFVDGQIIDLSEVEIEWHFTLYNMAFTPDISGMTLQ